MDFPPDDFATAGLLCRWQPLRADQRAQDMADAWLRTLAGDRVADGLYRDERGRPRLEDGDAGWSHSHGKLLIAYAGQGRVGVDVERRARRADALRIAQRYFDHEETAALADLDDEARQLAFLRLWCAKEAVLKAHGGGIAFGLDRVVFGADGGNGTLRMLRCDPALGDAGEWSLHELAPEPGFIAILATTPRLLR